MTALRELLARFTVEVDPEGNLPKGNRQVDALRDKLIAVDGVAAGMAGLSNFSESLGSVRALLGSGTGGAVQGLVRWNQALAVQEHGLVRVGSTMPDFMSGIGKLSDYFPAAAQQGSVFGGVLERLRNGFNAARQSLNEPRLGFISQIATLKNAFIALGAVTAAKAVWGFTDATLAAADAVGKGAVRLGVTTDQFQELQTVAALGGATIEDVGTAFTALTRNAEAFARTGEGEAAPAFSALGLQVRGANGELKPAIELFFEAGDALNELDNETIKQAHSQKLLGESGRKLFPVFASLSKMTAEQRAELRATAIVYGEDFIAQSENANDQMLLAGKVVESLKARFIGALLPAIVGAAEGLQRFGKWLGETTRGLSLGRIAFIGAALAISPYIAKLNALVALGGGWVKVAGNMAKATGGFAKAFLPLTGLFLLVEDLATFFAGGDSLIGRGLIALDKALGGTGETVKQMTEAFKDFWKWILGDGQGDKAKALYRDIVQGIELMVHDLLVNLGIRDGTTGLGGLEDFRAGRKTPTEQARDQFAFNPATGAFMPVPQAERQGTTVIDNSTKSVTMNMQPGASPTQNADAVSKRLESDRASVAARVP